MRAPSPMSDNPKYPAPVSAGNSRPQHQTEPSASGPLEREQFSEVVVDGARVRRWLADGQVPGGYAPYPGMLHDPKTDEQIPWRDLVLDLLWKLPEGARVSIQVDCRLPLDGEVAPDDYWILVKPHTYRHVRESK